MNSLEETGIYFIDATSLSVCHNKRITRNKVFDGLAQRGKTTMGWFFGFKLHMVINHKGQIMAVSITKGNVDDRKPVNQLTYGLKGVIAADKGYLSKELFKSLFQKELRLIAGIRKAMKNILLPLEHKKILRKRFLIETSFDILKHQLDLFHTRHRSPVNAFINLMAALCIFAHKKKQLQTNFNSLIQN